MEETIIIKVDKEVLEAQIAALKSLLDDTTPKDYYNTSLSNALASSSGDAAEVLNEINTELNGIVLQMYLLMERTLGFLSNAHTQFIEADEGLAERLANGEYG